MKIKHIGIALIATIAMHALEPAAAVWAGLGMSANQQVLQQSKSVILKYMSQVITKIKLDDLDIDFLGH